MAKLTVVLITQDVTLPGGSTGENMKVTDIAVPPGTVVLGAGGRVVSRGGVEVSEAAPVSLQYYIIQNGPHPDDPAKWRFLYINAGGDSQDIVIRLWLTSGVT